MLISNFLGLQNIFNKFLWFALLNSFAFSMRAQARVTLDVNDVSYMWPPVLTDAAAAQFVTLPEVFSQSLFQEIVSFSKGEMLQGYVLATPAILPTEAKKFENWRVVSMRVDPCAPGKNSTCLQEVRLVAQPFSHDIVWEYYDFSFHILFEISAGDPRSSLLFKELVTYLLTLKAENQKAGIETNGVPLKVHPGFKRKPFYKELKSGLLSRLKNYNLKKITFSGAESEKGPWVFFQGLVSEGHYFPEGDPTLGGSPSGEISPEFPGHGGEMSPWPSNFGWPLNYSADAGLAPSIADLFYKGVVDLDSPARLPNGSRSQVFKLKDIIAALDNPQISNRTNTDCFSCHTSMSRALLLKISDQSNKFKLAAPNDHVTLKAQSQNENPTNFRMFGWFGSTPMIADRVINESAIAADIIEKFLSE